MPSPSTSRQRTLRIARSVRAPLRVVPSGVLRAPTRDPAAHRHVLIRLPWTRAVDTAGVIEQRAA